MTVWSLDGADLLLAVRLTPGATKEEIGGVWTDEKGAQWLSARVRAVPEKGRANAALIALLAKRLDWPRSAISLESGDTNRLKRLRIKGGGEPLSFARLSVIIRKWVEAS
ncbi:DUF167 family protein [Sphingobium chlorophenolicum]|uniref:UPF0235 protein BV95_04082 n=1 Tax=Sphingobium chlorophenolicum TaxID=46429 RepID=A0A081R8Y1_SPHCR|nr:DUF167 family protein [Sphingobium chlorophenolicum]KEQ51654.1 hypothetical protein BV95_04082 [Sphingobium chlorophenolicum]